MMGPEQLAALLDAVAALEQEAENYRDGDEYQPRGKALHRLAKKARAALTKAGGLLEAAKHVIDAASAGIGPLTASELRLRDAIAKAESP